MSHSLRQCAGRLRLLALFGLSLLTAVAFMLPMLQADGAPWRLVFFAQRVAAATRNAAAWLDTDSARAVQDTPASLAAQLLAEAEKLRLTGTTEARRAASEKYQASLPLWQSLGDRGKEATARHGLCSVHNALQERIIALSDCEQALTLRQAVNDQRGAAETLNLLGNIQLALRGPQAALDYFQRALALRRTLGDQRGQAVTLGNLARLYEQLGDSAQELEALRQALPLAQTANDKALENNLLDLLGNAYNGVGEVATALGYFQQSLALSRARNDKGMEANTLSNLGRLYYETGEKQQAFKLLTEAIALHRANGNRPVEGATLITLAALLRSLGETDKALRYGEEALRLTNETGSSDYQFFALQTLGDLHRELGAHRKALEYDQISLALARARSSKAREAIALAHLAIDWRRLNDFPQALAYHQQAIALQRETGDRTQLIFALLELCDTQLKFGDHPAATQACRESLDHSRQRGDRESQANALAQLAQIAIHQDALTQARDLLEEALGLIESTSAEIVSADTRAVYLGYKHQLYTAYIGLLMKLHQRNASAGYDRQAWQTTERARARALLALLAEAKADIRQGVDPVLRTREKEWLKQLETKAAEQARLREGNANEARRAIVARELNELATELEQIRAQIKLSSPRYAALTQPQPLTPREFQAIAASTDTLLLEYALGEEQSFLFAITGETFNSYELPKREMIETAARRYHELLTARNPIKFEEPAERAPRLQQADKDLGQVGNELSRMILAPVAAQLKNRHLLIVADGALQLIPFAALPVPESGGMEKSRRRGATRLPHSPTPSLPHSPLVVSHAITYLPSASVLGVLRRDLKDRAPAPKLLAVFADPVFEADDERLAPAVRARLARERQAPVAGQDKPAVADDELTRAIRDIGLGDERGGLARLPYTRAEAAALLALAPAAQSFSALDFAATQEAVLQADLSRYRYVHFATHGLIDNVTPELSGLVLSRLDAQGRDVDGYLRLVEIYNLNLPAELVVLSACKTGLGKEVRGEGLMSLTRGFMHAGAARVLVSLWDVNDKSTARLMGEFYRGLLRERRSPAAALRAAQLWMLKQPQWAAPYYWAAFVQHGEPR